MQDLLNKRDLVRGYISSLDELAFWFSQQPDYITDEIGIMFESSISRLMALDGAMTIRIRQMSEQKLAEAMTKKLKSKERIENVRRKIENKQAQRTKATRPVKAEPKAKPSARASASRTGRSRPAQAKR